VCRKYCGACSVMPSCVAFRGCNLAIMIRCFCFRFHPFAFLVGVTRDGGVFGFWG